MSQQTSCLSWADSPFQGISIMDHILADVWRVYLPIGWVSHVEKEEKRSKERENLRDLL